MPLGSIQRVGLLLLAGAGLAQGSQDFRSAICMPHLARAADSLRCVVLQDWHDRRACKRAQPVLFQ